MNQDLISRQAAIDAVCEYCEYCEYFYNEKVIQSIKEIPSAQPEHLVKESGNLVKGLVNDCVSRQAAILAIERNAYRHTYVDQIVDIIKWLPSESSGDTSGTQKEIKRTETHSCDCERTETHGWIPVTEALPEDGVTVWVTIKGHDVIRCEAGETLEQAIARISKIRWVTQGYWSDEEHGWNDPSFGFPLMVQPIAWMPINTPEPWREQE